jgi:hypothetical protein
MRAQRRRYDHHVLGQAPESEPLLVFAGPSPLPGEG